MFAVKRRFFCSTRSFFSLLASCPTLFGVTHYFVDSDSSYYRAGDVVSMTVVAGGDDRSNLVGFDRNNDVDGVLRRHMPLFALDTSAELAGTVVNKASHDVSWKLSFSFGRDGSNLTPWFRTSNHAGEVIDSITVTFTYSSKYGRILMVRSSRPKYVKAFTQSDTTSFRFNVNYVWEKEAEETEDALTIMLLFTFLSILYILLHMCNINLVEEDAEDRSDNEFDLPSTRDSSSYRDKHSNFAPYQDSKNK